MIADIVASRALEDRAATQRDIDQAVLRVDRDLPLAERPLTPVLGDELQGTYRTLTDAMASLLLLRLALPEGADCRYGIGVGEMETIPSRGGDLAEGPAWWAARSAIEHVHRLQSRAVPGARTAIATAAGEDDASVGLANAYLLARDQLVSDMSARTRRLTYGRALGVTQAELARVEGITQSAVSQALASAGSAAIVEGFRALRASSTPRP